MNPEDSKNIRRLHREEHLSALRDGRKTRSVYFADRKKEGNRKACRKGNW